MRKVTLVFAIIVLGISIQELKAQDVIGKWQFSSATVSAKKSDLKKFAAEMEEELNNSLIGANWQFAEDDICQFVYLDKDANIIANKQTYSFDDFGSIKLSDPDDMTNNFQGSMVLVMEKELSFTKTMEGITLIVNFEKE